MLQQQQLSLLTTQRKHLQSKHLYYVFLKVHQRRLIIYLKMRCWHFNRVFLWLWMIFLSGRLLFIFGSFCIALCLWHKQKSYLGCLSWLVCFLVADGVLGVCWSLPENGECPILAVSVSLLCLEIAILKCVGFERHKM